MNFKKHYKTPVRIKQMLKQKKKDLFLVGSYSVFCCVLERNKGGFTSARGGRTSVFGSRTSALFFVNFDKKKHTGSFPFGVSFEP